MKDCGILADFSKLRNLSPDPVKKKVSLNLLQYLIMLYIKVRTFSFVKDKQQLHKIKFQSQNSRSLRTEIKKSSGCLDQGSFS